LDGPILTRYLAEGGPQGELGFPTTDRTQKGDVQEATFEGGRITYDTKTGEIEVEYF
jgi:uncharacterized protein with LGFP repeats